MKRVPARLWDLPSALLLVLAQMVVGARLIVTGWSPDLNLPILLILLGAILGLVLGVSRFKPPVAALLAVGYSLVLFPLCAGAYYNNGADWPERLGNLAGRLAYSFGLFLGRRPVQDTLLFIVFISILFWTISLTAGYALTRSGNFLGAVLPAGIALFIIQLYDPAQPERVNFLAVYFFVILFLLGRLTYVHKRYFWKDQQVWFASQSATDLNLATLFVALALVLVAWLMPVSNQPVLAAKDLWSNLTKPFQQTRRDLGNAIAGLRGNPTGQTIDFYGSDLALGLQASGGTDLLFSVQVPGSQNVARYYWQVRTYDQYLDGVWHTTSTSDITFSPSHTIDAPDSTGMLTDEFTFKFPQANIVTLITPPNPIWISRPAFMTYIPAQDDAVEPVLFQVDPPVHAGETYKVHAVVSNPTVTDLESAGTRYPAWVADYYLQLPADLPPVIASLARQITAGAQTPYDKAQAITQYLRDNIQYTKSVQPTPPGEDALVWFLFDSKAGFCNYYASAEVVLLRSVGVPARLAVGYAEGEYQPPDWRIVRQEDAHAWPEVYFPALGWVEFEPTTSQSPLARPVGGSTSSSGTPNYTPLAGIDQPSGTSGEAPGSRQTGSDSGTAPDPFLYVTVTLIVLLVGSIGLGLLVLFAPTSRLAASLRRRFWTPAPILAVAALERIGLPPPLWLRRSAYLAGLTPLERAFRIVYRGLRWLGAGAPPAETPAEAAHALSVRLPSVAGPIDTLLNEYEKNQYSQHPADLFTARQASEAVRRKSLRAAALHRLAALKHLFRKNR